MRCQEFKEFLVLSSICGDDGALKRKGENNGERL